MGSVIRDLGERSSVKAVRDRVLIALPITWICGGPQWSGSTSSITTSAPARYSIMGKGRRERESQPYLLKPWRLCRCGSRSRGSDPGPLFLNLDRARKGGKGTDRRLGGGGFWSVVKGLGLGRPHGCVTVRSLRRWS